VQRAKLASVESVTSAQMEPSQTLTARAAFRAAMGLRVRAVAAMTAHLGSSRIQTKQLVIIAPRACIARAAPRAATASRLGSTHRTVSRAWCVMRARHQIPRRRDVWSVLRVQLEWEANARSVQRGRHQMLRAQTVAIAPLARRVSRARVASVTMATHRTVSAQLVLLVGWGRLA
jgi:hypothetical protein